MTQEIVPSNDNARMLAPSAKQAIDSVSRLEDLMLMAQAAKRNSTLAEADSAVQLSLWLKLVQEFGMKAFERGLEAVLLTSKFFPDVAEIRQAILDSQQPDAYKPFPRMKMEPDCKLCNDTGWEPVLTSTKRAVKRCRCKTNR